MTAAGSVPPAGASWHVEAAGSSDAARIALLLAESMPDPWSEPMVQETLGHGAIALVVRGPDDRLVAAAILRVCAPDAEILQVAVTPLQRRQGLGRHVLREVVGECVRRGARAASLEVRAGNAAARALYGRAGFRDVGLRRGYYRDGEDAVLMGRELAFPLPG